MSALRLISGYRFVILFFRFVKLTVRAHTEEKYCTTCLALAAERNAAAPAVPTPCHALFPELLTRPIASVAVPGRASAHAFRWALGV